MNRPTISTYSLAAAALLIIGCPEPVVIDDPVQGPIVATPSVTLRLEVPETELDELLDNLVQCTAKTFGPYNEDPANSASPTFTIKCHVTETRERGIDFNCETMPNGTNCDISALYNERVASECQTPSGKKIWFHIVP